MKLRLADRVCCSPAEFVAAVDSAEAHFEVADLQPVGSVGGLEAGAYYLKDIKGYKRTYERHGG